MVWQWLGSNWTHAWLVVASSVGVTVAVISYPRIAGLRSFSKMSSFDFAITIAFGSIIASVAVFPGARLLNGIIALGALYGFQALAALARRRRSFGGVIDNVPLLLMVGDEVLHDNLSRARVTESDIRGKLGRVVCRAQVPSCCAVASADGWPCGPILAERASRTCPKGLLLLPDRYLA